ncbi:Protection of telomeres protein 1 [Bienertia sinuspersici]
MDANECNPNHLDADVRLPPRKRLLAGLKKQSCSESTSQCSQENNPSPSPNPNPCPSPNLSFSASPLSEFDFRLNNLLKSYKNGSNMSPEEIAEAAGSAASAAAKAAEAARAAAEEKASAAAKAVAAAKSALDLVASISEETSSKDKLQKKNKLKKHVPVQLLYNRYQPVENCGTDEELARRLHRAMNSSPRIAKPSQGSDSKNQKQKKLKFSPPGEKSSVANGDAKLPSACNGDVAEGGMDFEGSNEEPITVKRHDEVSKSSKPDDVEVNSGDMELSHAKEKTIAPSNDVCISGRKRGRIKQKKLPLSLCSSKDQSNPKEDQNLSKPLLTKARTDKSTARHVSLLSLDSPAESVMPHEVARTWKCQDFKVSQCLKQDKAVQS